MASFIWDMDGTLVDSYPAIVPAVQEVCAAHGYDFTEEYIHEAVIRTSVGAFIHSIADGQEAEVMIGQFNQLNDQRIGAIVAMPHAKETLAALTEAGNLCFVYTHRGASCHAILENTGLLPYFTEVVTALDGFARKPEPDAILYLMDKYGLAKDSCFYVGDRSLDIEAAYNAGIGGILYLLPGAPGAAGGKETLVVKDLLDIAHMDISRQNIDPNRGLFTKGISRFLAGLLIVGILLFLPAGTFAFPQAWLLIGILFVPMFIAGLIMMKKSPDLLRKRLNVREEQTEQREVILLSGLMFLVAFILAGMNFRFGWLVLPFGVSIAAAVIFLLAYALYAEVLRENVYLSRTVEVQENQKVIDTGLYGVVRHPMYMTTVFLFLAMPLVLGSLISFVIMLAYIPIIAKRIRNEEVVLEEGLDGYKAYKERVRYKVIPFIW